jgi:hypothetical protein
MKGARRNENEKERRQEEKRKDNQMYSTCLSTLCALYRKQRFAVLLKTVGLQSAGECYCVLQGILSLFPSENCYDVIGIQPIKT